MSEIETAIAFLDRLADRGRRIRSALAERPLAPSVSTPLDDMRAWQTDVAAAVNELSGGSKAHWLSKAFSAAFLIAAPAGGDGALVVEAPAERIVERLLTVIDQAKLSLTQVASGERAIESTPPPRRFEFVSDAALRPVLEQAYLDADRALHAGETQRAFLIFCGLLESVITDSLRHRPPADVAALSFNERIAAAESDGLIHAGCRRLPESARRYRDRRETDEAVAGRDADLVRQVLRVVMRDLDPGR